MRVLSAILFTVFFLSCQGEKKGYKKSTQRVNTATTQKVILDTFNSIPIVSYRTKPVKIEFFLKDENGNYFNNHGNLKKYVESKDHKLIFAMNGGMYLEDSSPQGLYIEDYKELKQLNTKESNYGNFYLKPNGVFYIVGESAQIVPTESYGPKPEVKFAKQSGPMLLINGKTHPKFTKGSRHVHIRNGVGILSNGDLLFAMSKDSINFYDFASYFAEQGCKNALYLDGAISKTYLPQKGIEETTGKFGVIIAEIK